MKKTEAMELAKECVEDLAEALRGEEPREFRRYLEFMSRFHRYSLGNILMIMRQRPDAEFVAGYQAWKRLDRWVKPGEKGIAIFAPMVRRGRNERQTTGADEERELVFGYRMTHVFDIQQTEGEPIPRLSELQGDPGDAHRTLQRVIRSLGIALEYGVLPMKTFGASAGGKITIAEGLSLATEFQVLAHELAHELLHHGKERHHSDLPKKVVLR